MNNSNKVATIGVTPEQFNQQIALIAPEAPKFVDRIKQSLNKISGGKTALVTSETPILLVDSLESPPEKQIVILQTTYEKLKPAIDAGHTVKILEECAEDYIAIINRKMGKDIEAQKIEAFKANTHADMQVSKHRNSANQFINPSKKKKRRKAASTSRKANRK